MIKTLFSFKWQDGEIEKLHDFFASGLSQEEIDYWVKRTKELDSGTTVIAKTYTPDGDGIAVREVSSD